MWQSLSYPDLRSQSSHSHVLVPDQRAQAFQVNLVEVGAAAIRALRRFEDHRSPGQARVIDEVSEAVFADVLVAGITAGPRAFRIIGITLAVGYY